jgi:arabinoxylan arabinofuranohydrolase
MLGTAIGLRTTTSFFDGVASFQARVASGNYPGTSEFRKSSVTGQFLGTCSAPNTGGWQTWTTVSCSAVATTGTATLYTVFHGQGVGNQNPNVEWFKLQ